MKRQRKGRTLTFVLRQDAEGLRSCRTPSRRDQPFMPMSQSIGATGSITRKPIASTASARTKRKAISAAFAGWSQASIIM
jgi:hypothetical protein